MSNDQQTGASPVTRVEFELDGGPYPFVAASDTLGCEFELAEMVPRGDGEYAEFFDVHGADPERVLDGSKSNSAVDATLIRESEDGGLFEFVVSEHCPAVSLAEQGALPRTVHGSEGRGRVVAEIPPQYDPASVIAAFLDENPESELVCKQKQESFPPMFSASAQQMLHAQLTDRQREILRAAFENGYYDWPRGCTGEEIASEFGISSATFSEHIHAAERKLLTVFFDSS